LNQLGTSVKDDLATPSPRLQIFSPVVLNQVSIQLSSHAKEQCKVLVINDNPKSSTLQYSTSDKFTTQSNLSKLQLDAEALKRTVPPANCGLRAGFSRVSVRARAALLSAIRSKDSPDRTL